MNLSLSFLDDREIFSSLIKCVEKAAESIMAVYNGGYDISIKEDNSPVTSADESSNEILTASLPTVYDVPVLSEEGSVSWAERQQWKEFWLVDPLDGTKEFIRKNGEFTINVALIYEHQPVIGIMYVPCTGDFFYAARKRGAYKRIKNGWQRLHVNTEHPKGYITVCSRHARDAKTESFLSKIIVADRLSTGSALKFTYIAEGRAHLYPRYGPTCLWDVAAGHCIVEEAGGQVIDKNLNPLKYNHREEIINPPFLACARIEEEWTKAWQES